MYNPFGIVGPVIWLGETSLRPNFLTGRSNCNGPEPCIFFRAVDLRQQPPANARHTFWLPRGRRPTLLGSPSSNLGVMLRALALMTCLGARLSPLLVAILGWCRRRCQPCRRRNRRCWLRCCRWSHCCCRCSRRCRSCVSFASFCCRREALSARSQGAGSTPRTLACPRRWPLTMPLRRRRPRRMCGALGTPSLLAAPCPL